MKLNKERRETEEDQQMDLFQSKNSKRHLRNFVNKHKNFTNKKMHSDYIINPAVDLWRDGRCPRCWKSLNTEVQ